MEAALELAAMPVVMTVARDGREVVDQLDELKDGGRLPDLVLLDLNMPRMNGFEVLTAIRRDPALAHLPVVVFTTSTAPEDVKRAYALNANSYVSKPVTLTGFMQLMERLGAYWFGTASLPRTYHP
ncbi:response regulator [Deinococcus malanensis]